MRYLGEGINWQWYHTDTYEEAVEWYKEITNKNPEPGTICSPLRRVPLAKYDDKWGFRIHR